MGILDSVAKPIDRPVIVTICGDSGMGKTTLAATFPKLSVETKAILISIKSTFLLKETP